VASFAAGRTPPRVSRSPEDTEDIAATLAHELSPGATVLLYGDLGAGKTAFVRGLAAGLGIAPDEVSSPTFTLVQTYQGTGLVLHHADLYRLDAGFDVEELGLGELAAEGVLAVEWAERWTSPPPGAIAVHIIARDDDTREITIGPAASGLEPGARSL
jgi:tRNA threonylcarbamoyladenosine biosynthesis protein TsaE